MSTSIRRRLISSADSASRWNSDSAGNRSPSDWSARVVVTVIREGPNSLIQLWTVRGIQPGPSPTGSPVSRNAAFPSRLETQTTPCRVPSTPSSASPASSSGVRKRSTRGRGITSRAMWAAKSAIHASTCPASRLAIPEPASSARGMRRSSVSGSPFAMYTDEAFSSPVSTPKISRPAPARRCCL